MKSYEDMGGMASYEIKGITGFIADMVSLYEKIDAVCLAHYEFVDGHLRLISDIDGEYLD